MTGKATHTNNARYESQTREKQVEDELPTATRLHEDGEGRQEEEEEGEAG